MNVSTKKLSLGILLLTSCLPVSTAFGMEHDDDHVIIITQAQWTNLKIAYWVDALALMSLAARNKSIQKLAVPIEISASGLLLYQAYRQKKTATMAISTGFIVGEISPEIALLLSKIGLDRKYYEFLRNHRSTAELGAGLASYVGYMGAKTVLNSLNHNKKEA